MTRQPESRARSTTARWWTGDVHRDRRAVLLLRNAIKRAFRNWFEEHGFVEVETASLQVSPGNETHLHAFETRYRSLSGTEQTFFLHTSPEFACKKLLAAGEEKIFTFAPVYRNRECGAIHHPEFTMLEWYEVGCDYRRLMEQCTALVQLAATVADNWRWQFAGRTADMTSRPRRICVIEAFERYAAIRLLDTMSAQRADRDALAKQASVQGIRVADDDTWSDIFARILVERVEPALADRGTVFLFDYPIQEAALARPSRTDARIAERFEFYCCGVELANGFSELTDPREQRARFVIAMNEKERIYGARHPLDETFLEALADMPDAAGCALGFDRLVMLATGAQRIEQVIWTPLAIRDA